MNSQRKMRVVQVGVGGFGGARRKRMRETGLFDLVGAYDWNSKVLARACEEESAEATGSYEELINLPDIEAVVISTGAKYHAQQVLDAAEKGLHVFVEKPLCSTPAELNRLLELDTETDVIIGVGHNDHKHDAVALTIQRKIDAGELGDVVTFEKTTAHSGGLVMEPDEWRADPEKNPGGMLFQCGVHSIHELAFYFGPIAEVYSTMQHDIHSSETADIALCHLRFTSGLVGTLNAYHVTPYRHTLSIFGTRVNIYRDVRYHGEGTALLTQETHLDGKEEPRLPLEPTGENDVCGNLRSFYNAVRSGDELYPSLIDGARAVAVVFAAEKSAREKRWVEVDERLSKV
ncbi:MAG: Gfo/Idh/MocA family oxidoreductase [Planctomycetes bacterium]|nr:Gfo/Idh/MocA family oxidoreductase [Planctomycetota bacterium]